MTDKISRRAAVRGLHIPVGGAVAFGLGASNCGRYDVLCSGIVNSPGHSNSWSART